MSFDLQTLTRTVLDKSHVVRILVAQTAGSAPRNSGTSMLVWSTGQSGTIGGGALEFDAVKYAHDMLRHGTQSYSRTIPLGPSLGQCCGGSVALVWEQFDPMTLPQNFPFTRRVGTKLDGSTPHHYPQPDRPVFEAGWLSEARRPCAQPLWIWGAGHVGHALALVLGPLPHFEVSIVDISADRIPETIPPEVTAVIATDMPRMARHVPPNADHLIVTHSHAIDLALCDTLLDHGFDSLGLIGSTSKWARFRSRLAKFGHSHEQITRIACPIGDPALGKHPQAIAVGVASALLCQTPKSQTRVATMEEKIG